MISESPRAAEHSGAPPRDAVAPLNDDRVERFPSQLGTQPDAASASSFEEHLPSNAAQLAKLSGLVKNAEGRFRALFENAGDAIALLSAEGAILEVNARCGELLGMRPEQLVGRHIDEYAPTGSAAALSERYRKTVAEGGVRADRVEICRPDGRLVHIEFSISTVEIEGALVVFSIGRDVTEQVEAQRALAAAEDKYRSLLERLPEVIWTATGDGALTFITPNVTGVLGFSVEELLAQSQAERNAGIDPASRDRVLAAHRAFAETGTPFDLEYRRKRKDGRWVWLRDRSVSCYEDDGVRYFEGMLSDITERRQLEDSFRQAQKMEAVGQLTGGIAHDFNNILAAILAGSHFLIEALSECDPRRADAEDIQAAAEKAASLTRQLLAFSRRQVLDRQVIDLNTTVAGVERMLRRLIGEDIRLTVALDPGLGPVRVDVGQIEQVIMNLAVNARDAMPAGGTLSIETANASFDDAAAHQISAAAGEYVVITVTDTGSGMDAATRERIFEPFFTTKELGRGTGLGLSTVYGIVKQSGGHIWVYSELGRGTVFKIYLPRVDARVKPSVPPPAAASFEGSETILLIEDDARVRAAVRRMLEPRGYRLLVAANGREALELAASHAGRVDLVLSDVIMPDASGPAVADSVRAIFGDVKALFMSGYTDHALLDRSELGEGVGFIQKPFAPAALAKKVREVCDA